jgi:hypothetical protein
MARVIHLFASKGSASDAAYQDAALMVPKQVAIGDVLTLIGLLAPKIQELETHLDRVDRVIDDLPDCEMRQALQDMAKVNRGSLIEATRELALQVRKLAGSDPDLIARERSFFDDGRGTGSGRGCPSGFFTGLWSTLFRRRWREGLRGRRPGRLWTEREAGAGR